MKGSVARWSAKLRNHIDSELAPEAPKLYCLLPLRPLRPYDAIDEGPGGQSMQSISTLYYPGCTLLVAAEI